MELWTGLVALKADPKCKNFRRFGKGKGAYVNVVGWAETAEHFAERLKESAEWLDCILLELEDIGLVEERMQSGDLSDELLTMQTTARRQPEDIVFGTFHIWVQDETN